LLCSWEFTLVGLKRPTQRLKVDPISGEFLPASLLTATLKTSPIRAMVKVEKTPT
jgi:hypothetical protein